MCLVLSLHNVIVTCWIHHLSIRCCWRDTFHQLKTSGFFESLCKDIIQLLVMPVCCARPASVLLFVSVFLLLLACNLGESRLPTPGPLLSCGSRSGIIALLTA